MENNSIFKCSFCGKEFPSKNNLNIHQNNAKYCLKKQGKESNIECIHCKKKFGSKQRLDHHLESCKKYIEDIKSEHKKLLSEKVKCTMPTENKKILFIDSNEEYIYHKMSRENKEELYEYLCKINDILQNNYPNLVFKIINIDIDNKFKNYGYILNYSLEYNHNFLIDVKTIL